MLLLDLVTSIDLKLLAKKTQVVDLTLIITCNHNIIYIDKGYYHFSFIMLYKEGVIHLPLSIVPIIEHVTIESLKPCSRGLLKPI